MTPTLTSPPSPESPSFSEEPILHLPPGTNLLSPEKPLIEMTDEELAAWDAKQRQHLTCPQTLISHLRGPVAKSAGKTKEPAFETSEYE